MAAMVDNSPPSATSSDINGRSQAFPASRLVRNVGQSSQELQLETGTWLTRNASRGGTRITSWHLNSTSCNACDRYFFSGVILGMENPLAHPEKTRNACRIYYDVYDNYDSLYTLSYHHAFTAERIGYLEEKEKGWFGRRNYTPHNRFVSHIKIHKVFLPTFFISLQIGKGKGKGNLIALGKDRKLVTHWPTEDLFWIVFWKSDTSCDVG